MSDQQFDIIFRGDIVFGHQLVDVKLRLQQLFKADAAKVDALFSGRPVPLKRGLDQASAQKYKEALQRAGAQVDIVPFDDSKLVEVKPVESRQAESRPVETKPVERAPLGDRKSETSPPVHSRAQPPVAAAPSTTTPSTTAPSNTAPSTTAPLTLAQRLAQQEEVAKREAEAVAKREALQREQSALANTQGTAGETPSWSLAPIGADLLAPAEKAVQELLIIDTSSISLRAEGGNLLDASEQLPAPVASVRVPNLEVAEVGADLVRADEKMDLPLLEIELEDWGLADLGEDLIAATEKPVVAVPVIHVPDVSLAPVGTDLGQLKPQVAAVAPDTSGLSLAD